MSIILKKTTIVLEGIDDGTPVKDLIHLLNELITVHGPDASIHTDMKENVQLTILD